MTMNKTTRTRIMKIAICFIVVVAIPVVVALLVWKVWDAGILEKPLFQVEPSTASRFVGDTAEGPHKASWTSDGATIVFGSRGRSGYQYSEGVYVVDAEGTQLTRWAPEGAEVAWWEGDFAYDATPHVNPVTSQIVYATLRYGGILGRDRGLQLATAELDGSGYRRLTESDSTDLYPAWSPDGTRIAFVSKRGDRYFRVYIMDADGSNVVEAAPDRFLGQHRPLWSPDGVHLAFRRDGQLYTVATYTVTTGPGVRVRRPVFYGLTRTDPAWSPDGEWLAFSHREPLPEWSMQLQSETIYMVRPSFTAEPDASASRKVIRLAQSDGGLMDLDNLSWTPDGTALRFTAALGVNHGHNALHQVLADGSRLTEIATLDKGSHLAWSPDGSRVAVIVARGRSSQDGLVYTMAPDGSDKRTIVVEGPDGPEAANGG